MKPALLDSSLVVIEDGVEEFVASHHLRNEFDTALERLESTFDPSQIAISLIEDPDEDTAGSERLLFKIKCGLERKDFRAATERFFEPMRTGHSPLYFLIGILRDI